MNNFNAFFDEMNKIAEEVREHPAKTLAKGVGGFALGAGTGYVGMHGIDQGIKALGGKGVSPNVVRIGAPLVGGGAGLGYGLLQHRMMERMKSNLQPEEAHSDGQSQDPPA